LFKRFAQPSILTVVTIILDDYLKTNPGVKDLPQLGIEPQPPNPQSYPMQSMKAIVIEQTDLFNLAQYHLSDFLPF